MEKPGEWIRRHRKAAGLTQGQVGERARVSLSYVSTLERGQPHSETEVQIQPDRDKVIAIAKAVKGDPDELLPLYGYAPLKIPTFQRPESFEDFTHILQCLGIEIQNFHAPPWAESPEFYHNLLDDLARLIVFNLTTPPSRTFRLGYDDADEGAADLNRRREQSPPLAHFPERRQDNKKAG